MERYFNSLKCELLYNYEYRPDEELNIAVNEYAYIWHNHVRPTPSTEEKYLLKQDINLNQKNKSVTIMLDHNNMPINNK